MSDASTLAIDSTGDLLVQTGKEATVYHQAVRWVGPGAEDGEVDVQRETYQRSATTDAAMLQSHRELLEDVSSHPALWRRQALKAVVAAREKDVERDEREVHEAMKEVHKRQEQARLAGMAVARAEWLLARATEVTERALGPIPPGSLEPLRRAGLSDASAARWHPDGAFVAEVANAVDGLPPRWASSRFGTTPIERIVVVPTASEAVAYAAVERAGDGDLFMVIPSGEPPQAVLGHLLWAKDAVHFDRMEALAQTQGRTWVEKNMGSESFRPKRFMVAGPASYVNDIGMVVLSLERAGNEVRHDIPPDVPFVEPTWERVAEREKTHQRARGVER